MRYKPPEMTDTLVRRPLGGGISQAHRDITDDRYRDLRKPRKVKFYCNGDRYFKGKKIFVTPHRYLTFNDLLNDLTGKLPATVQLPYGVRQIFTPVGGRKVRDIDELQDGQHYVCAGFEIFKPIPYGKQALEPWASGRPHGAHEKDIFGAPGYAGAFGSTGPYNRGYYNAFQPGRSLRQYPRKGGYGYGNRPGYGAMWSQNQPSEASLKPKVVTVIRNGAKPRSNVKILLNRRSVQSYEQLVKDISEAFGPKWKNNKVRKLFSIRGREIQGVGDFFRDDDVFIGIGNESLTTGDVHEILEELYPDSPYSKNLMKEWEKTKKKQQHAYQSRLRVDDGVKDGEKSKIDSGLGSDESARDEAESETTSKKEKEKKKKKRGEEPTQEDTTAQRLERERVRYAEIERERARKRLQKRMEADRRVLDDERRKKGLVPLKSVQDPFKKMQEEREQEKREEQARQQRELEERREKDHQRDLAQAEARARSRARKAQEHDDSAPKVIVVVKGDLQKDAEKAKKSDDAESRSQKSPVRRIRDKKEKEKKDRENEEKKEHKQEKEIKEEKPKEKVAQPKEEQKTEKEEPKPPKVEPKPSKEEPKPPKEEQVVEKTEDVDTKSVKDTVSESASKPETQAETPKPKPPAKEKTPEKVEPPKSAPKTPKSAPKTPIVKDEKIKVDHETEKKKKQKSKIVRKTKFERQISNVEYVLEKYEPGKTLGDGNFAIVKSCKLKNTSHEFAMKIVDKSKLRGKEHMIENEIAIMKRCNHQRIVKLMEEYETKTEIYLIMELVKGGDLFDAITQSVKFDEKTASGMCTDVVSALFYLHSRDIVHRDLKPENLLVLRNKDGSISLKLADFGLAMEVHQPIYTVCGTPTYVAPEILSEIGYGLEVDMWAVGVITYILLCGFPPFRSPDRNQTELFEFIKAGEYDFLSPYWDNISRAAKDLISRLLIVDRKKRYSATDVLVHPWIITFAGSKHPPVPMDEHRRNLRASLETQAKANKSEYIAEKQKINSDRS